MSNTNFRIDSILARGAVKLSAVSEEKAEFSHWAAEVGEDSGRRVLVAFRCARDGCVTSFTQRQGTCHEVAGECLRQLA